MFTRDVANMAYKATGLKVFKDWFDLLEKQAAFRNDWQAELAGIAERFDKLSPEVRKAANDFLRESTLEGGQGAADVEKPPFHSTGKNAVFRPFVA